jgi:hypothetical protein
MKQRRYGRIKNHKNRIKLPQPFAGLPALLSRKNSQKNPPDTLSLGIDETER